MRNGKIDNRGDFVAVDLGDRLHVGWVRLAINDPKLGSVFFFDDDDLGPIGAPGTVTVDRTVYQAFREMRFAGRNVVARVLENFADGFPGLAGLVATWHNRVLESASLDELAEADW